jgi:hypothetical protein
MADGEKQTPLTPEQQTKVKEAIGELSPKAQGQLAHLQAAIVKDSVPIALEEASLHGIKSKFAGVEGVFTTHPIDNFHRDQALDAAENDKVTAQRMASRLQETIIADVKDTITPDVQRELIAADRKLQSAGLTMSGGEGAGSDPTILAVNFAFGTPAPLAGKGKGPSK